MAKALLLNALHEALSDYVVGLSPENLKVGVWSGKIVLDELQVPNMSQYFILVTIVEEVSTNEKALRTLNLLYSCVLTLGAGVTIKHLPSCCAALLRLLHLSISVSCMSFCSFRGWLQPPTGSHATSNIRALQQTVIQTFNYTTTTDCQL